MSVRVDYPELLDNFPKDRSAKRSESAWFLIWYLMRYYRLDKSEAIDAVCDQGGDKGVDGIFINDNNSTITIFQSKISHKSNSTIGDASLRNFLGTLEQFSSPESVNHLLSTAGGAQVAALIHRSGLIDKLATHEVRGEFVVNIDLDHNGMEFLRHYESQITFVGKKELIAKYYSDERGLPKQNIVRFDILGISCAEHVVDENIKAVIAPIRAKELITLDGIEDQSLFTYNVRGPLNRTGVNKELATSIKKHERHENFPLFHNGITIITNHLKVTPESIEVGGYFVVNGCQSITALHANQSYITDELKILTKFIRMDPTSAEAGQITEFSNNQNSVKARDFKSNDSIQIRLRNEFERLYKGRYCFEIKRGEASSSGEAISNEEAGLYMMAFDLREPWYTHRKYEVFEDKHGHIFGKPYVTADRIVMLRIIYNAISEQVCDIEEDLLGQYPLTRYMLMYMLVEMLAEDKTFQDVVINPEKYVRDTASAQTFKQTVSMFVSDIITDINEESKDFEEDFDYRKQVKNPEWVMELTKVIRKGYQKNVKRGKQNTFEIEWNAHAGK